MSSSKERTVESLASLLEIKTEHLRNALKNIPSQYTRFPIRRTRNRPRWIDAPAGPLKAIQRQLLDKFLYNIKPHDAAHGFYPGRSIVTNARPHSGKGWILSLDVKDFFPSTTQSMVTEALTNGPHKALSKYCELIAELCCLNGKLPQGAPTSPHLANLAFFDCDVTLSNLAQSHALTYTRYADDMTFSGDCIPDQFEDEVIKTVTLRRYTIAKQKTKRMGQNTQQKVTGLIVNERVLLPRTLRRKLRAILHEAKRKGLADSISRSSLVHSESELFGYLALKSMVESPIN